MGKRQMAETRDPQQDVFSLERIRSLIDLMKEHGLTEIDLRQDEQQIRLSRAALSTAAPLAPQATILPAAAPAISTSTIAAAPSGAEIDGPHVVTINSPMVGTFYSRPNPNAKNFVESGSSIQPDTVVCIIEAMKVFNEIPAEVRGKVVAVLVQNEEAVDFGKPLFRVDTRG